jgi:NADH:ubiquinone oxidoreductase subunit 6 (subunit J)
MDSRKLGDLQGIIDYTYGTSQETTPDAIDVGGNSKLIDEDVKSLAVDSFNQFWGSDVITVDNFSDYFGDYYIDTTYNPSADSSYLQTNIYVLAAFIILLALMIYLKIKAKKQADEMVQAFAETGVGVEWTDPCKLQAEGKVNTIGQTSYVEEAIESVPLGILGAIIGAVLGGILWVIVGRMGYIAGICGFAVILLAMKGYKLLGKKLSRKAMVLIIIISLAVLFAANYVSYTWTLVDAINKNEAGKGDFATVFNNHPLGWRIALLLDSLDH